MEKALARKTPDPLVIGVDGGGTKTAAWLAPLENDGSGVVLGRGLAGPGNPRAVGFDAAQANIDAAIAAAFADANLPRGTVAAACLALAGAGRPDEQARIAAWASTQGMADKIRVCGDAEPILAAAAPDNVGIALIAGTGSLAWGRNAAGATARCGGWGFLLGDEGSGYAIAVAGLRAAVRSADGRGPKTDLLPRFLQKLQATTAADLISKIYGPEMTRDKLAALASVVFDLATTDAAAELIISTAVNALAELVVTLAARLQLATSKYTLAIAGGVLLPQLKYADRVYYRVYEQLSDSKLQRPDKHVIVEEPVAGTVELARWELNER
jgi:N-acetylglucosamine kinase-like BadF-type ATPase